MGDRPAKIARKAGEKVYKDAETALWTELTGTKPNKEPSPGDIMEKLNELTGEAAFDQDRKNRVTNLLESAIQGQQTATANLDRGRTADQGHKDRVNWYRAAIGNLNANETVKTLHK